MLFQGFGARVVRDADADTAAGRIDNDLANTYRRVELAFPRAEVFTAYRPVPSLFSVRPDLAGKIFWQVQLKPDIGYVDRIVSRARLIIRIHCQIFLRSG